MRTSVPSYPRDLGLPFDRFRKGQRLAIREIVNRFNDKRIVMLEGPTGSGKSVLAMAVAAMTESEVVVTTQTKQLSRQYEQSFPFAKVIEGRDNFQCTLAPNFTCAEGPCIAGFKCENKASICPYYIQKNAAIESGCVVTNIWYYINEVRYVGKLRGRQLLVVDEGHLLEQALLSVVSIDISATQLARIGVHRIPKFERVRNVVSWAEYTLPRVKAGFSGIQYEKDPKQYRRFQAQIRRLESILDYVNEQEWLLTRNMYGYSIKPVWVRQFGAPLVFDTAERVLIMSATIRDPKQFGDALGVDEKDVAYVEMPSYFPKEHRPVNFWPVVKVGYKTSYSDMMKLVDAIDQILEKHEGEKGVIHCVSYKLRDTILENSRHAERLVTHNNRDREEVINSFKSSSEDDVLLSPSVAIGLDLPDDQGRFAIIAKLPFLSLADAQVKRRQEEDPRWYTWATACALIQSCGRVVRSPSDFATVYLLDANGSWFLKRNSRLFPKWWKEAVYRISDLSEAVVPNVRVG